MTSTPLRTADVQRVFDTGVRITPLRAKRAFLEGHGSPDMNVAPHYDDWEEATHLGVLCGACPGLPEGRMLLGVDLDGDVDACPVISDWLDSLPDTLWTHGDRHAFFSVPASTEGLGNWTDVFRTRAGWGGAAVDLRWASGYMCETPSEADWPAGALSAVAELPAAALEALLEVRAASSRERAPSAAVSGVATVVEDAVEARHGSFADRVGWAVVWLAQIAPVAKQGAGGHDAAMVVFGGLIDGFLLDEDTAVELAEDHWNDRCDPPWEGAELESQFRHKAQEIERQGSTRFRRGQLAEQCAYLAKDASPARVVGALKAPAAAPSPPEGGFPTKDASDLQLCGRTGWPWILQKDTVYWFHNLDRPCYGLPVKTSELEATVHRELFNVVNEKLRSLKNLKNYYIRPVAERRASFLVRDNTYDPSENILTEATLRWKHTAREHADVSAWLSALFGGEGTETHKAGLQWLASCCHLDRESTILYLYGTTLCGKGTLARGLANLWDAPDATCMEKLFDKHNKDIAKCPVVFADEQLPQGVTLKHLREWTSQRSWAVEPKGVDIYRVEGYARFYATGNNPDFLKYVRTGTMTRDDRDAVCNRLTVIKIDPSAATLIREMCPDVASYEDLFQRKIPEHVMWLGATVALEEGRAAATAVGGDGTLDDNMVARHRGSLLLVAGLYNYSLPETPGVFIGDNVQVGKKLRDDSVWVSSVALSLALEARQSEHRNVEDFFNLFGTGERKPVRFGKKLVKCRRLDDQLVLSALAALELASDADEEGEED